MEVVDFDERKRKRKAGEAMPPSLYWCECGCAMWRLWADGTVQCLNCECQAEGLAVVESEAPAAG